MGDREMFTEELAVALAVELGARKRQDLVDKFPAADTWVGSDVAALLIEAAAYFDEGLAKDAVTSVERALEPKWGSATESKRAYLDVAAGAAARLAVEGCA